MNSGVKPDTLTPAQLQRLGLDTQPFNPEPPAGRPFKDAAIDTQVNVALHILQHTNQVLLIQGADGLGKTSFLSLLNQAAGDELVLIHLWPGTREPETNTYRAIAEAGGIDGDDETSAVSALLRLSDMGQRPVLLLDDADHAPREAIDCLLGLHATMGQHHATPGVVMTAARDLVPLISKYAREDGLEPHLVNLHPLDEEQAREYVRHRLKQAGSLDGEQLTETQCRQIHHRTRGNPANINREAARLLAAAVPVTGAPAGPGKPNRWLLPVVVVAVAALVGGLIAASYLVDQAPPTRVAESPAPEPTPQKAKPEREPPQLPNRKTLEEKLRAAQSEIADKDKKATTTPEASAADSPDTGTAPDTGETPTDRTATAQAPDSEPDTTRQPQEANGGDAARDQQANDVEEAPEGREQAATEQTPAVDETEEAAQTAQPETETEPEPEPAPKVATAPPDNHYTIQLIGAYDRESLDDFIADADVADRTRIMTTRRDGRDWHVVVYGDYASRDAARSALQGLPAAVAQYGPWVRSFGSLR